MNPPPGLFGYLWLTLLAALLVCSAVLAERGNRQVEEYPFGCDSFGYLQSAQSIRKGVSNRGWPELALQQTHTDLLVNFMKARNLEVENWEEIVAPHAYRYYPRSGRIGPVFPPGAGLLLAIFPQGDAVHGLNRLTTLLFLLSGLAILVWAAIKRAWMSAGIVVLAWHLGLAILMRIGSASFSINALLAPLLLSSLCLFVAFRWQSDSGKDRAGWWFALLAGIFFGFAVLVRPPVGFVIPGLIVLLWPTNWPALLKSKLAAFGGGVLLGGVLPLGLFQSRLVGAWYLPTYGRSDMAPPTLAVLKSNLAFYFGNGDGSTDNLLLITVLVCFICMVSRAGGLTKADRAWRRVLFAALVMWVVPTVYFLTHKIAVHFYAVPATLATCLLLGLGAFYIESKTSRPVTFRVRGLKLAALLIMVVTPVLVICYQLWNGYRPVTDEVRTRQIAIPAELKDENSWIWGGMLTGTLWYYGRIPAYKVQFTVPETRALLYEFVSARGEKQFFIRDSDDMQSLEAEIAGLGGTLELRGTIDGYPYFLIHWPPGGPRKAPSLAMMRQPGSGAGE
jgi:hypothetical protein